MGGIPPGARLTRLAPGTTASPGPVETAREALDRATRLLVSLQRERGCWEGEMVWCPLILAQYVIVQRIVGRSVDESTRRGIVRHFDVTRTPEGGWGLHPESSPFVFVTTLVYVAARLLGLAPDDSLAAPARRWLRVQTGGVLAIPTWGKLWLAFLDLYDYAGVRPCPPELHLLPEWLPIHPRRYYCHTRRIYGAMAYLYGVRVRADLGPLRDALRRELYDRTFAAIDFARYRDAVAPTDLHRPPHPLLRAFGGLLTAYERVHSRAVRRRALARCFDGVVGEQRATRYQALSPVNGLLNCLVLWAHDPGHPDLGPSLAGLEAWRWADEAEGIRYAGARSHAWDTAFAVQALLAAPAAGSAAGAVARGYAFLRDAQLAEVTPDPPAADRDPARGGWCFSDGAHGWPVSDCTAEAVSALLAAHAALGDRPFDGGRISAARLRQAAAFILSRQNADGGFGTYERRRGPGWLEALNPSEMFGRCMTEGSYVECTGSALTALAHLRAAAPECAGPRIDRAMARGVAFLRRQQRPDGSVPGFWGINFTYGLFHFVRGLRAAGVPAEDPALAAAARWLIARQRADGGWGEHHAGCLDDRYVEHAESQVVMTSWAVLALLDVLEPGAEAITRGAGWLLAHQRPDGSWPRGAVNGVFFRTAMLEYRLYATYFPTWALARYTAAGGR